MYLIKGPSGVFANREYTAILCIEVPENVDPLDPLLTLCRDSLLFVLNQKRERVCGPYVPHTALYIISCVFGSAHLDADQES